MKFIKIIIRYLLGLFNYKIINNNNLLIEEDFIEYFPPTNGYIFLNKSIYPKGLSHIVQGYMDNIRKLDENFKINKNDTVIDIGAHHGAFSCYASSLGARVLALEANIENIYYLNQNKMINNFINLDVINGALVSSKAEKKNKYSLFDIGITPTTGTLDKVPRNQNKSGEMIKVENYSFEKLFQLLPSTSYILKIDIEGGEWEVLKEIELLLSKNKIKCLLGEFHKTETNKPSEIIRLLESIKIDFHCALETDDRIELCAIPVN